MYASAQPVGRKDQSRRQQAVSAFGRAASNLLAIPRLDKTIKATIEFDKRGSRWAKLALLWLDANELTEADSGHPRELLQTAVHRWMEKQVVGMKHLNVFDVVVHSTSSQYGDSYGHRGSAEEETKWFFGLSAKDGMLGWYQLEKRITALEQSHPGLGHTALHVFDEKACSLPSILTPNVARYFAQQVWWYWQDNQEDYEAEMSTFNEEEELDPGVCAEGPDWFDAQFPKWMFQRPKQRKLLKEKQLRKIVASSESDDARQVATQLLDLMLIERGTYRLPLVRCGDGPVDEECAYFLAYLCWNPNDPLQRLNDDHIQHANECGDGYTDLLGADAVPMDQAGFFKWKSELEAGFAVLRKLDALLPLIADPFE